MATRVAREADQPTTKPRSKLGRSERMDPFPRRGPATRPAHHPLSHRTDQRFHARSTSATVRHPVGGADSTVHRFGGDDAVMESDRNETLGSPAATGQPAAESSFVETARGLWQDERVEIVAAILLSLATVLSAWGAYQATRWSGEQADAYASSAALRASAGRQAAVASRQIQIDVSAFLAWAQAKASGDDRLATFLQTRFRAEFGPAFDAWRTNPSADEQGLPAGTPFDQPQYVLATQVKADELNAAADKALLDAQHANQISDNFVLTAVLFASVLFFAGTAAKFRPQWIRWSMIAVAVLVFCCGLVVEFSLPQNIGF